MARPWPGWCRTMRRSAPGRDLADALARTDLAEEEAAAWHRDLQTARKTLKTPADKWR